MFIFITHHRVDYCVWKQFTLWRCICTAHTLLSDTAYDDGLAEITLRSTPSPFSPCDVCVCTATTQSWNKKQAKTATKKKKNNVRSIIHNHSMALFVSTIHFVIYCLANCSRTVKISSDIYDRQRFIALCWTLFSIIYCFGCMCGVLHGHQTPSPRGCINIVSVGRFIIAS